MGIGANEGCEGEYRAGIIRIELGEGLLILARRWRLARLAVRQSAAPGRCVQYGKECEASCRTVEVLRLALRGGYGRHRQNDFGSDLPVLPDAKPIDDH